jgi:peptidoglycan/xylan/chitin deacetylase (PgdA/CDA1 family)
MSNPAPCHVSAANGVKHWRPALIIPASIFVHTAGVVVVWLQPGWWPWVASVVVANHLLIFCAVLTPRSKLLGPNLTHLPRAAIRRREICLTFDDGPDPQVTPRVLDLLDRHGAKASFFCVGKRAAEYPQLLAEIVRRGHSVENHSHGHSYWFAFFGRSRLRREIRSSQQALGNGAGQVPLCFRAPVGFRGIFLDRVLAEQGLRYVSWTRRGFDGVSTDAKSVFRRLGDGLAAGDILLLHDKNTVDGNPAVVQVLPALLDKIAALGLHAVSLPAALRDESGN